MTPFVPPSIPARRPHPAAWLVLAIAFLAQSIGSTSRTLGATTPPMFQAHGSNERLWLARTEVPPGGKPGNEVTALFVREKSDATWNRIDPIGSIVHGLGSRGSQLAILLPGGDWRLTTETGFSSGRPLPGSATLLALGTDADTLWALGTMPVPATPAKSSTSRPGSQPATASAATTSPTTSASAPNNVVLYRLGPPGWEAQANLPDTFSPRDEMSLGVAGGHPVVARRSDIRTVSVYRFAPDKTWELLADVEHPSDVSHFKLLGGSPRPVLFVRGTSGPSRLWERGSTTSDAIVKSLDEVPAGVEHAVAFANNGIRLLWIKDGKIFEQRRNSDTLEAVGDSSPMAVPSPSMVPSVWRIVQIIAMVGFVFAMAASFSKRREMQEMDLDPEKLRLAPFSARFIAGTIDALPIIAARFLAPFFYAKADDPGAFMMIVIGAGVYVVLTTLIEVLAGRSLGKMFTGLQVVGLDGRPASLGARFLRNILRVIDVFGIPLALILFSPLRQRAGDFAAGTLVISNKTDDKPDRSEDDKDQTGDVKDRE